VHHIDESRKTGILNNELNNLLTLCKKCHAKKHFSMSERNIEIIRLRKIGTSLYKISTIFNITHQRVSQICKPG
jgi:DNA-directed RNA polymerase sigma subunit (sigma70/sigma32)